MIYYVKPDGIITKDGSKGYEEYLSPLFDGKPLPKHKNLSKLQLKADGSVYKFYNEDYTPDLKRIALLEAEKYKVIVKSTILKALDTARVEVDGLAYDANEPSQARMDRAIQTLVGDETVDWRMYDNSIEVITQTELGKALRASGILMSKLWFCKSAEEVEAIVSQDEIWLEKYRM